MPFAPFACVPFVMPFSTGGHIVVDSVEEGGYKLAAVTTGGILLYGVERLVLN